MQQSGILGLEPMELVAAAFSTPLFSLVIALLVAAGILLLASRRALEDRAPAQLSGAAGRAVRARYLPELRGLGIAAIAVIALFAIENVVRGYLLDLPGLFSWWRYAVPLFCALVGMSVVLGLVVLRGTRPSETPVVPATRRTWVSFSPRPDVVGAGVVLLALSATTAAAGLSSSADSRGRYVWLEIPVPNEAAIDPIRLSFYGWAYGVPVLICLAALSIATWAVLHRNAARPYIRPETVVVERDARRDIAIGAVRIATASMLLALAGAWRLIADAGSVSHLVIDGQNGGDPYDAAWRYAELAVAAGWFAPVLEITAFVLLLIVALRRCRRPAAESSLEPTKVTAATEAVL